MRYLRNILFVYIVSKFIKNNKDIVFNDLNFRRLDFTNYRQIKTFIFKENFHELKNKYVQNFDFLNYSKDLGGKIGINLSKISIIHWFYLNKNKAGYPWTDDLTSRRLINILYNYEFINSSSNEGETRLLNKIILIHIHRSILNFKLKTIDEVSTYDLIAIILSFFILKKNNEKNIDFLFYVIDKQIDRLGVHKSYNILQHAKFLNNIYELKNIFLYYNHSASTRIDSVLIKMNSILNEYFHLDGSIPLFNGANNNYTKLIYNSLNKEEYLKSRSFYDVNNGIAFFSNKNTKLFFDVVQPVKSRLSSNLSAGTLAFEFSCSNEKIITNCGASESLGKNPEYLKYSAAHSTIILQNTNISEIKENNPPIKFPQSVTFEKDQVDYKTIFEGSHNGYQKKFDKIIKRKLTIFNNEGKIYGEDAIISIKNKSSRIIYHIRFHLMPGIIFNFTNNKKNIILKSKLNNMWLFKSDVELVVEDSILVDNNKTIPSKQIVIKGVTNTNKLVKKWSLEKIQ